MSKIKVLVTGSTGLVGSHFVEKAKEYELITPTSDEFDLLDPQKVSNYLDKHNPDWIVNYAAYTDVNGAESQKGDMSGLAWKINVDGVQNILDAFKSKNIIHISTDMVFPGNLSQPGPYAEDDMPPETSENLTWYGWTKNRAEKLIKSRGGNILRIIYPVRAQFDNKLDYIRGPLKRFAEGKMYPMFNDQYMSISFIDEITETIKKIIDGEFVNKVFHASSDTTNPYELIKRVLDELGEDSSSLKPSSIHEFLKTQSNPARYAIYGGLKTSLTEEVLETHFSTWQTVIDFLLGQGLNLPKPE